MTDRQSEALASTGDVDTSLLLWSRPEQSPVATLLLAHGAGGPMDTPFMERISAALARHGVEVVRFEFGYMQERRTLGRKRPPPRADRLVPECARMVARVADAAQAPLLIGGKSMGGRVAAMLAGDPLCPANVRGAVCLGYPFHSPGKMGNWRMEPLETTRLPVLICQGERDVFGNREEIEALTLPKPVRLEWIENGSHDLGPTGKSAATLSGNIDHAARMVAAFACGLRPGP